MNKEQFKHEYSRVRFLHSAMTDFSWKVSKGNVATFVDSNQHAWKEIRILYPEVSVCFNNRNPGGDRYNIMEIWEKDRNFTKIALWVNSRS